MLAYSLAFMVVRRAEFKALVNGVKRSFLKVKDELDDHLEAINSNTAEVQSLYDYLSVIEQRIDKLSDRLDEFLLPVSNLSLREQELFLFLYTASKPFSARELASSLGLSVPVVHSLISSLRSKDIPVLNVKDDNGFSFVLTSPEQKKNHYHP